MSEELQNAMNWLASVDVNSEAEATCKELLLSTITELDKENNALHTLYKRTADHLLDIEKEELANYLYAQIGSTVTWEVRDYMDYYDEYYKLKDKYKEMPEKLKETERKLEIKDEYMKLTLGLLFNYDGCYDEETKKGDIEALVELIDEAVEYLELALKCDDRKDIYANGVDGNKRFNILLEEIEEDSK